MYRGNGHSGVTPERTKPDSPTFSNEKQHPREIGQYFERVKSIEERMSQYRGEERQPSQQQIRREVKQEEREEGRNSQSLEKRLENLESKVDRILYLLESQKSLHSEVANLTRIIKQMSESQQEVGTRKAVAAEPRSFEKGSPPKPREDDKQVLVRDLTPPSRYEAQDRGSQQQARDTRGSLSKEPQGRDLDYRQYERSSEGEKGREGYRYDRQEERSGGRGNERDYSGNRNVERSSDKKKLTSFDSLLMESKGYEYQNEGREDSVAYKGSSNYTINPAGNVGGGSNQKNSSSNLLEEKRRQIDEEIERRIREEQEKRRKLMGSIEANKKGESLEGDFRHSPYSTEKSRSKDMINRLNLEKKIRDEKINKLAEIGKLPK